MNYKSIFLVVCCLGRIYNSLEALIEFIRRVLLTFVLLGKGCMRFIRYKDDIVDICDFLGWFVFTVICHLSCGLSKMIAC
jgi:hypothetical protein